MKKKNSRKLPIASFCAALTIFFVSCASNAHQGAPEEQQPPWPEPPREVQVVFAKAEDGLLLRFEEYRKLEENIIEIRRYIEELEEQLRFYRGELGK